MFLKGYCISGTDTMMGGIIQSLSQEAGGQKEKNTKASGRKFKFQTMKSSVRWNLSVPLHMDNW